MTLRQPFIVVCQSSLTPTLTTLWLDPGMNNVNVASELLKPFDARVMRCYPVATRVNHVANDDEGCSAPVELVEIQNNDLFP